MPFTVPNEGSASDGDQAEIDAQDFTILAAGPRRTGVLAGCAVTAQATPDMTVAVAAGAVAVAGAYAAVTAGNVTIGAAAASPRYDLIVVNASGVKSVLAGTAASNPVFPDADPATYVVLAAVHVKASVTTIVAGNIVDKRVLLNVKGPFSFLAASDTPAALKSLADSVCDGTADDVEINAAITALPSTGGRVVCLPGTYNLAASVSVTANKRVFIDAPGAKWIPAATVTALVINQGAGNTILGAYVNGLFIDGAGNATTTGIKFHNTDRARCSDLRIANCTTGAHFLSTDALWVEQCAMEHILVTDCATGVKFETTGTGTGSFGENHFLDVGINNCTLALDAPNNAILYRTLFKNVVIWLNNNQTGVRLGGDVRDAEWYLAIESLDTGTAIVGFDVLSTAFNLDKFDLHIGWTGTITTKVQLAAGKNLVWREGQNRILEKGNGRHFRAFTDGDTEPRFEIEGDFGGGGGVRFGPGGTTAPDILLYRNAANQLRMDSKLVMILAAANLLELWGANLKFNVNTSSGIVELVNATTLRVYSDNYATLKASIDGTTGDIVTAGGVTIGSGTKITKHLSGTAVWDPASLANGAMASTTVTVTGAAVGDVVAVGFAAITAAGWELSGSVTAADTVTVTLVNHTGGTVNLASGTVRASVWKY